MPRSISLLVSTFHKRSLATLQFVSISPFSPLLNPAFKLRTPAEIVQLCPTKAAFVQQLGCQLGCQNSPSQNPITSGFISILVVNSGLKRSFDGESIKYEQHLFLNAASQVFQCIRLYEQQFLRFKGQVVSLKENSLIVSCGGIERTSIFPCACFTIENVSTSLEVFLEKEAKTAKR